MTTVVLCLVSFTLAFTLGVSAAMSLQTCGRWSRAGVVPRLWGKRVPWAVYVVFLTVLIPLSTVHDAVWPERPWIHWGKQDSG